MLFKLPEVKCSFDMKTVGCSVFFQFLGQVERKWKLVGGWLPEMMVLSLTTSTKLCLGQVWFYAWGGECKDACGCIGIYLLARIVDGLISVNNSKPYADVFSVYLMVGCTSSQSPRIGNRDMEKTSEINCESGLFHCQLAAGSAEGIYNIIWQDILWL